MNGQRYNRRRWLGWCLAASVGVSSKVAAQGDLPRATPRGSAQTLAAQNAVEWDWHDPARDRVVPVRLYMPEGKEFAAAAEFAQSAKTAQTAQTAQPAPVPLVVFSHGIGGSRRGYSWLGRHFAQQGVASLHLQHVGSDRQLWSGSIFGLVDRLQSAAQEAEALARVQDLRFALDTLLASPLAARIDAQRIVAAGHSYGANTALLAGGARVQRAGAPMPALADARLCAAIVISAPPFYGLGNPADIVGAVQIPTLHITATEDIIRIPGYFSGFEDRLALFEATGSARKCLAVFEGGSHSMFTDRQGTGGVALNPRVKSATQELASAFLRAVFEGDGADMAAWPQRHRDILARFSSTWRGA